MLPLSSSSSGRLALLCLSTLLVSIIAIAIPDDEGAVPAAPDTAGVPSTKSFEVKTYASLGESFASGPSAGEPMPDDKYPSCRRYTQAFGPQLNADAALSGANRKFDFIACSGSKLKQIYQDNTGGGSSKPSESQAKLINGQNPELTTLSIGGNDVGFVNLLDHCVYGFYDPLCGGCGYISRDCSSDCDKVVTESQANIDGPNLRDGLDSAIKAIFANAPSTHLYITLYPRFFNADTTQCDRVQWNLGCSGSVGWFQPRYTILPLTQDRRRKMNALTDNLNNVIKAAVGRATPGNGGSIKFVDTNEAYERHRFCENGVTEPSYRNTDIWFYPYEFTIGGTLQYVQSHDNSTVCADILGDNGSGDWGDYYACEMAEGFAENAAAPLPSFLSGADPAEGSGDVSTSGSNLPDFLARIFHPTQNGMGAYKDAILSVYAGDVAAQGTTVPAPSPTESRPASKPTHAPRTCTPVPECADIKPFRCRTTHCECSDGTRVSANPMTGNCKV